MPGKVGRTGAVEAPAHLLYNPAGTTIACGRAPGMTDDSAKAQAPTAYEPHERAVMTRPNPLITWGWFVVKNVIGWALIVSAFPLGALIPGPGGIPLFLIGF